MKLLIWCVAFPQDVQDQEEACQEDEAEQAHPLLDPNEDRQHYQVSFQQHPRVLRIMFLDSVDSHPAILFSFLCVFSGIMLSAGTGAGPSSDFKVDGWTLRSRFFSAILYIETL